MGSAYSTLAADVIARHQRMRGRQVTLITGTDEHGEKIAAAAAAAGLAPQQHCDGVAQQYADLWQKVSSLHCNARHCPCSTCKQTAKLRCCCVIDGALTELSPSSSSYHTSLLTKLHYSHAHMSNHHIGAPYASSYRC